MTKKSAERIHRDDLAGKNGKAAQQAAEATQAKRLAALGDDPSTQEILKSNNAWTDLEHLFQTLGGSLATLWGRVVQAWANPMLIDTMDKATYDEVNTLYAGLEADVLALADELKAIHALHLTKRGNSSTVEEFHETVDIYEKYHSVQERMGVLITTNAQTIMEHASTAVQKAAVLQDELNPDVVTDVQVKGD